MKRTLILIGVFLAFSGMEKCRAALGLTPAENETMYQKPIYTNAENGKLAITYEFRGFHIRVTYQNGISISEGVHTPNKASKLSDAECLSMAAASTGEMVSRWKERPELSYGDTIAWSVGDLYYALRSPQPGAGEMLLIHYGDPKSELTPNLERCQVPLGKMMADFEAKYGKPEGSRPDKEFGALSCLYNIHGERLLVMFRDRVAFMEVMVPSDKDVRLSARTCVAAARAISGVTNWVASTDQRKAAEGKRFWDAGKDFSAIRTTGKDRGDNFSVANEKIIHEVNAKMKTGARESAPADAK